MIQNKAGLSEKRKSLKEYYEDSEFKRMKTLNKITIKAAYSPDTKFGNLMRIITEKDVLLQAMGNINTKSGALTPGTKLDPRTADESSLELISEISETLKNGTFRFKPIRRIYMDKSGKNPVSTEQKETLNKLHKQGKVTMDQIKQIKARPIGISSFPDKVVQEAMRMALNAIYEPEFARTNTNFGFRPGLGCQDAISELKKGAKSMDYAIEGDIKGAFDNVNHELMIQILEKKINDQKFLKLVRNGLKCGVIYMDFRQDSEIGTTQGSVVSPLLYNIYFHEFDIFVSTVFKEKVNQTNQTENRTERPVNKLYNSISKKKTKLKLKNKINKVKELYNAENKDQNKLFEQVQELKETKTNYKILDKQQKKIRAFAKSKQTLRFWYTRYADDWVFLTNADLPRVEEWKELFKEWIDNNLKLSVSEEKTKLTKLNKGETIKFLGFQLKRQMKQRIVKVGYTKKIRTSKTNRTKFDIIRVNDKPKYDIRGTNPSLIVAFDRDRILTRLTNNLFIKKVGNIWRGRSKLPWTTLPEPEIIERYNYMIRGYLNYFTPVLDYPNDTHFLHYLLKYSCAHTLAQKRKTSLRKIFQKFGKDLRIQYQKNIKELDKPTGKILEKEVQSTVQLLSWEDCTKINEQIITRTLIKYKKKQSISTIQRAIDEICNVKINWRTKYKLSQHCCICGNENGVEYHHVKHIKIGKTEGFLQIMKQLNRRQIPVCKQCHTNIHRGEYNGMSLKDLYDEELIII